MVIDRDKAARLYPDSTLEEVAKLEAADGYGVALCVDADNDNGYEVVEPYVQNLDNADTFPARRLPEGYLLVLHSGVLEHLHGDQGSARNAALRELWHFHTL